MFLGLYFLGLGFLVFRLLGVCMVIETPFCLVLLLRRVMIIRPFSAARP